jgi:3-oxoacyl-[acyl-carrier-protein] synthase-3
MAYLAGFGHYVPARVVTNAEIGARVDSDPEWILSVSGIAERRFAADDESLVDLAVKAGEAALKASGVAAAELEMVMVASGSSPRSFPGPAVSVAERLGALTAVALDLPMASAGSLFGLALAARLARGPILVIGAEKMSTIVEREPLEKGVAILFGDGAGACVVHPSRGPFKVIDAELGSDGAFAEDLKLEHGAPLFMNGRSVILQASRKIPAAITALLKRNELTAADVPVFLMHQANQNLIDRVAQALEVEPSRFFSNIRQYGNTSSASMLIAASEWSAAFEAGPLTPIVFAAFGAGFHWGALLTETHA